MMKADEVEKEDVIWPVGGPWVMEKVNGEEVKYD